MSLLVRLSSEPLDDEDSLALLDELLSEKESLLEEESPSDESVGDNAREYESLERVDEEESLNKYVNMVPSSRYIIHTW